MDHSTKKCPIAIVGMACRYPDADNVDQLFENSLAQRRSFRDIPDTRLSAAGYFDPLGKAKDRTYSNQAALIKNFNFDRAWFRVSRASYEVTDLTHWLALTVAEEAIKDIKFRKHSSQIDNEAVRVVVGNTLTGEFSRANLMRLRWPYVRDVIGQHFLEEHSHLDEAEIIQLLKKLEHNYKKPFPIPNEDSLAGGLANTIAGRICNHFDFKGGGYTVDGACSSSLLAVTDACSALVLGDADMVLAGGVDISVDPFELVGFSRTAALARNNMLVYDKQSEGFWPGEGCGFVALMRYEDAVEQCEHIHAVIQGWGMSSDGRGGLTRPESEGQLLALERCYKRAGYGIETVGYFEGHGTGTKVGDTTELKTLINARNNSGQPFQPAIISSIKANIGHTKAAAGIAGLLRATKCLSEKILPPTTACRKPHALFENNTHTLRTSNTLQKWNSNQVERRAGVSAMGFGGINTHIAIEEAPASACSKGNSKRELNSLKAYQDSELFLFSAVTRKDLIWTIDYLATFAEKCSQAELTDLAVEMARRVSRGALSIWKAGIVASTPQELSRKLKLLQQMIDSIEDDNFHLGLADGIFISGKVTSGKIGFIFSGQGSPVRKNGGIHADRFEEVQRTYLNADLNSLENQTDTDFAQPAIVTASLAGIEILKKIGINGDVAIGHSLGELAALHWAGCFDDETLVEIAKIRGQVIVDDENTVGAMAAIAADREQTVEFIKGQKNLFIANINSPKQTVVSGRRNEIEALALKLKREGVLVVVLNVQRAFHTPSITGAAELFGTKLQSSNFYKTKRKVISTVTGSSVPNDTNIAKYLCDQLISPVHFLTAANLAAEEVDLFIEIGPGEIMTNLTRSFIKTPVMHTDIGGDSFSPFLNVAAAAYVLNCAPNIGAMFSDRFARRFDWGWSPSFFKNPCEEASSSLKSDLDIEHQETDAVIQDDINEINDEGNLLERLRQIIAIHTGLPSWTLQDGNRMLSDLHLNSITVGEIVTKLTASSGMLPPVDPTAYANASIVEIATAVEQLMENSNGSQDEANLPPDGVDTWIRYFEMANHPVARTQDIANHPKGKWDGFGEIAQNEKELLKRLNSNEHRNGVIVWLNEDPNNEDLSPLLNAAKRCIERNDEGNSICFILIQNGWGGSGFARSFSLENEKINTVVINLPLNELTDFSNQIVLEIDAAKSGFKEVFIDTQGHREEPRMSLIKPHLTETKSLIDHNDVVLITGGGKGISAECGYQLAQQTGCSLLILGRSKPEENDELANNLKRLHRAKVRVAYQVADVTNAEEVSLAVGAGIDELGSKVTVIVHGAGLNTPRTVTNLSLNNIEDTVSPKILGLRNLLAAVDPKLLKVLVTFSSIIARIGLHGEADYALANEWLSHETKEFQERFPTCRCRSIEWSVWSGTGMGQRLGRLDALSVQGISPISIDGGVKEFLRLIETPDLPTCLIVTGRFGNMPTFDFEKLSQNSLRFIDSIRVYYPNTELVVESHLSILSDPYLDDHVLNGERLFPAVMAFEAMTEAIAILTQNDIKTMLPKFRDVKFRKAIVVPKDVNVDKFTLRVAVLVGLDGDISLAIRCSTTNFKVNHVEAKCTLLNKEALLDNKLESDDIPKDRIHPFNPDEALYQNVLFQNGRFKKIQGYQLIEARRCSGLLSSDQNKATQWFSKELPQTCLLGDPGIRDAALHSIQACIPHKIVIPISVEEIDMGILNNHHSYKTIANEIEDRGNELIYNLSIFDNNEKMVEQWRGIKLRVMGEPPHFRLNSPPLMGPFFERKVAVDMPLADLKVRINSSKNGEEREVTNNSPFYRPDGKPEPLDIERFCSTSYTNDWKLSVDSATSVGCDLQKVISKNAIEWKDLLGKEDFNMAEVITGITNEKSDVTGTRVWAAREAMKKAGLTHNAPLIIDPNSTAQWLMFNSGDALVFLSLITGSKTDICVAVALCQN